MRLLQHLLAIVLTYTHLTTAAAQNTSISKQSTQILPSNFKPPQVFRNVNLVRNINLDKSYARETINVVIENIDKSPQSEYYVPFDVATIPNVGGFEARDRNDASKNTIKSELIEYDEYSPTQFYKITLPTALTPKSQFTLSITYNIHSVLTPLPALIDQTSKQYVQYALSAYASSSYPTQKQRTKLKLYSSDIPDFTVLPAADAAIKSDNSEDPVRQGNTLTYGPFTDVPAGAHTPVTARFDFTRPLNHVATLERDLEVSHWGGNIATEERYVLTNAGARLKEQFNRVAWTATAYYNPPTSALKSLTLPLHKDARSAYFVDDVGNVSTSHFRLADREARLQLKPRYPVFGGWQYKFKVGWDRDVGAALRKMGAETYALNVPFLEGPRDKEGVVYERVKLRVVLPEGATNVRYETSVPIVSVHEGKLKTFMDTVGRTTLTLGAVNLVDDFADRHLVVTYEYPAWAGWRKPLVVVGSMLGLFAVVWVGRGVDVSISATGRR